MPAHLLGRIASALAFLALGAGFERPPGADEESERRGQTIARALPQPAPGTRLSGVPAVAAPRRIVHMGDLAREAAKLPPWVGPLVGIQTPETDAYIEPDAPADRPLHVSTVQSPTVAGPEPAKSFMGLDDIPRAGTGSITIPPDTDGAVGLTKIMEGLNNNYRIMDKSTGAVLSTVGIHTFWAAIGPGLASTAFDPKTLYDPINNRWIVCAVAGAQTATSAILVGVSQTSDPSGAYFVTSFDADAANLNWADFPTIGFNKNWVAINVNMFPNAGGGTTGSKVLVLDYAAMRTGTFTATMITGTGFVSSPVATYSPTENTLYVPTHLSSASGSYRLDTITGTPTSPIYTIGITLSRGITWTQAGGNALPQAAPLAGTSSCSPSPPCRIETQDAQIRSTPVFRGGSIFYTQTIGLPAGGFTRIGVLWTKINAVGGAVQDGGIIQDPTATATNGGKWYAYPHIAVNACGDLVVGYSQFASNQYASAGYSYRLSTDAPGTLRDPVIYRGGEDYYRKDFGSGRNRWGDYSKAQVDPSDDHSLWVLQEHAKVRTGTDDGGTGTNSSKWSTWWAKVAPVATIAGVSVAEGNAGTTALDFTVTLSLPACTAITVNYNVTGGTATLADNDFQTPGSSIVIPANATSGTITIQAVGDNKRESDETLSVTLTSLSMGELGATISAVGTIQNDDPVPTISIADDSANEGNAGTSAITLDVTLSNPTDQTVQVTYATVDNTATLADNDYVTGGGNLTFPPGTTGPQTATFDINGDTTTEPDEVVRVNLSGPSNATLLDGAADATILNDDSLPTASIGDAPVTEGNAGVVLATFTVTLSHPSATPVSVAYQTNDGTATIADLDYDATSGTLNIPALALTGSIDVNVNGNALCEPDEAFTVTLSSPSGVTIGDDTGEGTITNDDECVIPVVTVVAPNVDGWHYFGEALDLEWTATDDVAVTSVDLKLSRDGGSLYEDIALGEPNDGIYNWTVTGPSTDQAVLQVIARDGAGNSGSDVSDELWHIADVVNVPLQTAVSQFALGPIRPNPARHSVNIGYALPTPARVKLDVVDIQGRVVAVLVNGEAPSGRNQVTWQPQGRIGSGLFFARFDIGGKVFRQRFVVTR